MAKPETPKLPPADVWYVWRVPKTAGLAVPHRNPYGNKGPMYDRFATPEAAMEFLEETDYIEDAVDDGWVLCCETTTPIPLPRPWRPAEEEEDDDD